MAHDFVRVRRISRIPLRIGTTNISNATDGSVVDLNDPLVIRDIRFFSNRLVILGEAEAGMAAGNSTINPNDATAEITNATGVILFTGMELGKGVRVASATWYSGATAAGTPTAGFGGLYSTDGTTMTRRAVSADSTNTALAANAPALRTFTTAYTTPAAGLYFFAWLMVATTANTLVGAKPFNSVVANLDSAKIYATLAGQATLGTTHTHAAVTAANGVPYIVIG